MAKESRTLKVNFTDEAGKAWCLSISNPVDGVSKDQVKAVSDQIINNNLVKGEVGFIKAFTNAVVVTRTENEVA